MIKDQTQPRGSMCHLRSQLLQALDDPPQSITTSATTDNTQEPASKKAKTTHCSTTSSTPNPTSTSSIVRGVKELPSPTHGLTVYEFFSGIGGMRLSLPSHVHGIPIKHFVAYDCSRIPNQVYEHNFHTLKVLPQSYAVESSVLRTMLVEGLQVKDVDGKSDVWTMSPPCQPCKFPILPPFSPDMAAYRYNNTRSKSKRCTRQSIKRIISLNVLIITHDVSLPLPSLLLSDYFVLIILFWTGNYLVGSS
jgi:hypothetical protein